jgi:hypothetical protein
MSVNEPEKGKRRFFAVTSLGKNRWYWVVWPSLAELQASEEPLLHIGEGYQKTKAEAVERALSLAGMNAEWAAAKYARAYHGSRTGRGREGRRPGASLPPGAPVMQEFLYRDVYSPKTHEWVSMPHRVVKKTSKTVFVEESPYSPDEMAAGWFERENPTFRLDRQALEKEGYAFIPAGVDIADTEEPLFYRWPRQMRRRWYESLSPRCLVVLDLSWPCTVTEVKGAFRRLVKQAHPDGGGTHDEFLALQEAYEQALRMFR